MGSQAPLDLATISIDGEIVNVNPGEFYTIRKSIGFNSNIDDAWEYLFFVSGKIYPQATSFNSLCLFADSLYSEYVNPTYGAPHDAEFVIDYEEQCLYVDGDKFPFEDDGTNTYYGNPIKYFVSNIVSWGY